METNLIKHVNTKNKLKLRWKGKMTWWLMKLSTEVTCYLMDNFSYHVLKQARSSMHVNVCTFRTRASNDPVHVKCPSSASCEGQDWAHTNSRTHAWTHGRTKTHGMDMHTKLRSDTPTTSCAPTGRRTDPDVETECEMTTALFTEHLFYFSACSHSAPCNMTFDNYLCKSHLSKYETSPAPFSHILLYTGGWRGKKKQTNRSLMQLATFIICFETKFRNHIMT